jgi:hypothetical protein
MQAYARLLPHNAHLRDNGCCFGYPFTLFLTALAPYGPCDHDPLFLGSSALPSPTISFSTFGGPNMVSHELRAGSSKDGCLCSIIIWASSTTNMGALPTFLIPFVLPQPATYLPTELSFHFPGSTQGSSSVFCPSLTHILHFAIAAPTFRQPLICPADRRIRGPHKWAGPWARPGQAGPRPEA